MTITKQTVADKIAAYLHHEITLAQLVDWSERALMDGELAERDAKTLSSVIARLGVADMRAFGLAWEDCEELLRKLGFSPRVSLFVHASEIINHFGRKGGPQGVQHDRKATTRFRRAEQECPMLTATIPVSAR